MLKKLLLYGRGFLKNRIFLLSLIKNFVYIVLYKIRFKNLVWIHLQEHIGDIVACEPVSSYARNAYENAQIVWITKYNYKSLVVCNKNINHVLAVSCIFEWMILKKIIQNNKFHCKVIDLHIHNRKDSYFPIALNNPNSYSITLDNYYDFGSILESFSLAAGIPQLSTQPSFHFCKNPRKNVLEKYIVLHCSSNESIRNWDSNKWLQLMEKLIIENYTIIEIGLSNVIKTDNTKYKNYCGKKNFQDIAHIIAKAELFIGIDSGFAHFANSLKIPSVILLGRYRVFKKYMPYTGYFTENVNDMVIQYDGLTLDIPVNLVVEKAMKLLNYKENI